MSLSKVGLVGLLTRFAARLRFPYLFFLFAILLALDLLVPDPFPFADEIVLALGTLLLARMRKPASTQEQSQSAEQSQIQNP